MSIKYVLITAARNEAPLIGKTIESVAAQTILPEQWVIVSDASTDQTYEIIRQYVGKYSFIRALEAPPSNQRGFASKVAALKYAYPHLQDVPYDFIGNLDADVTLPPNYLEQVLERFSHNPKLGIGGGMICEQRKGAFKPLHYNLNSVAGAVQMFRRGCYEQIGGYMYIESGVDSVAEVMARMQGWEVRTFQELEIHHHRRAGTKSQSVLRSWISAGRQEYLMGSHPLFHLGKCIDRFRERPYVIGGILLLYGYINAAIAHSERPVSRDFVAHMQNEQLHRMRAPLRGLGLRK